MTVCRRPTAQMWSIAEYTDHVRETVFGMRFLLDIALADPGLDLGEPPQPVFEPDAREIDVEASLAGFDHEVFELCSALAGLPAQSWRLSVVVGGGTRSMPTGSSATHCTMSPTISVTSNASASAWASRRPETRPRSPGSWGEQLVPDSESGVTLRGFP